MVNSCREGGERERGERGRGGEGERGRGKQGKKRQRSKRRELKEDFDYLGAWVGLGASCSCLWFLTWCKEKREQNNNNIKHRYINISTNSKRKVKILEPNNNSAILAMLAGEGSRGNINEASQYGRQSHFATSF